MLQAARKRLILLLVSSVSEMDIMSKCFSYSRISSVSVSIESAIVSGTAVDTIVSETIENTFVSESYVLRIREPA